MGFFYHKWHLDGWWRVVTLRLINYMSWLASSSRSRCTWNYFFSCLTSLLIAVPSIREKDLSVISICMIHEAARPPNQTDFVDHSRTWNPWCYFFGSRKRRRSLSSAFALRFCCKPFDHFAVILVPNVRRCFYFSCLGWFPLSTTL